MRTTTSLPPNAVSPPMVPPKRKPAAAASRISFSIVEVLLVASTRYSTASAAAPATTAELRDRATTRQARRVVRAAKRGNSELLPGTDEPVALWATTETGASTL